MAFQVSPGVQVKEVDLTNVIPAVSSSIGAIAGDFSAGPILEVTTVSSETELVSIFGQPNSTNYKTFFQASSFLKYGNALRVVRASSGQSNSTSSGTPVTINNRIDYENNYEDGQGSVGSWAARSPGTIGSNILVSICPADAADFVDAAAFADAADFADATAFADDVALLMLQLC